MIVDTEAAVFATDWLGSSPVFYNERTLAVSHNINDVIDCDHLEFDPEGLAGYLDFGYSVFGQTPIRDVKYLLPSCRLVCANGRLGIEERSDPFDTWPQQETRESDVLEAIEAAVREWEDSVEGDIVVPTSGGYDSRLLTCFVRDKSRIRAFTYGLSSKQQESFEVVHAKALSQRLGTRWQHVGLGGYHRHIDEWLSLYGASTHAHGMYHIEFYRSILATGVTAGALLSGIIGDVWAGLEIDDIGRPDDLKKLGYTHGMHASSGASRLECECELREAYFVRNRERLRDPRFRVLSAMRFKLVLLSYLMRMPAHFGFKPWSPFLKPEIALAMLFLPPNRRRRRAWQQAFFRKVGLDFESERLGGSRENNLNLQALAAVRPPLLKAHLLSGIIAPDYVRWINRAISGAVPVGESVAWRRLPLSLVNHLSPSRRTLKAYCAYLCLAPLQDAIARARVPSAGAH